MCGDSRRTNGRGVICLENWLIIEVAPLDDAAVPGDGDIPKQPLLILQGERDRQIDHAHATLLADAAR